MKKLLFYACFTLILMNPLWGQQYKKTTTGVKTNLQSIDIEIKFYSPSIVRILKSPEGIVLEKESLSVVKTPENIDVATIDGKDVVSVSSSLLKVEMNLKTGKISFADVQGNKLLTEKDYGAQFAPTTDVKKQTYTARQAFLLDKEEALYGLGQQQNGKLMQRGQRISLKNENTRVCIPYFLSLKGYGLFWDNYASTLFNDNLQETSFESLGDCVDYYFMLGGTPNGVTAQMRDLTGQAPMQPLWAYGYWQSRERYKSQFELMEVVKMYRQLQIPLDGIIQDWQYWGKDSVWNSMLFDPTTFPAPKAMVDSVHAQKAHIMIVAWPGFGPKTKQFAEFKSKDMLIDFDTWPPNGGVKPYDVYDPAARDIYWDYLNKGIFSLGTDAWWLDSSEPDHINIKEADFDQSTHLGTYRSVVNAFPLVHVKGVYDHQRAVTSDKRVTILTRSAFAGQQRFGANTWSGDVVSSWESLTKQIPAALNFSLGGIPYWNADIGGFFAGNYHKDGGAKNPEFQELYVRWLQFATFTPMMRSHGTDIPREIYKFGNKGDWAFDAIAKNINLRYRLLPYLYSTAWGVTNRSGSFIYALPMLYPNDENVLDMTDQFLFGTSLLIAPVIQPMYTSKKDGKVSQDFSKIQNRSVYLPKGNDWYDFWTGQKLAGGQQILKETPIDITPVYVKAGAILPWGPQVQYATEKKWDNLEVRIYPGADGEFVLYEDENDNYNYEKGLYSTISFKWNDKSKQLTIDDRKGQFAGMLTKRQFRVLIVDEKNGMGGGDGLAVKTISYKGKAQTVNF